jgi:archaellum component FlaC
MRHQHNLKQTKMLIDAVEHYIYTIKDAAPQYAVKEYQELLKELEEEEALLERTIKRDL